VTFLPQVPPVARNRVPPALSCVRLAPVPLGKFRMLNPRPTTCRSPFLPGRTEDDDAQRMLKWPRSSPVVGFLAFARFFAFFSLISSRPVFLQHRARRRLGKPDGRPAPARVRTSADPAPSASRVGRTRAATIVIPPFLPSAATRGGRPKVKNLCLVVFVGVFCVFCWGGVVGGWGGGGGVVVGGGGVGGGGVGGGVGGTEIPLARRAFKTTYAPNDDAMLEPGTSRPTKAPVPRTPHGLTK